ncbi:MAG: CBS domain-containing protein [Campylobacterales bacterium]
MKFPLVKDIASTSIILISISSSVKEALNLMLKENHRNAIVIDGDQFKILTVVDILNLKRDKLNIDTKLSNVNLARIPTINKNKNVLDTIEYLNNPIEHICILNENNSLYGLITHTDIISNIDPDTLMDNYRLSSFLKYGRRMKLVSKDIQTFKLLEEMINETNDNVIIVDKLKPIGILTTKDIMKILNNDSDLSLAVENYMSSPVDTIDKNSSIKEALDFLKKKHYKRVIVVEESGNIYGIV